MIVKRECPMIYIAALRMLWLLFVLIGSAAIVTRLMRLNVASRCLTLGLLGSAAGFLISPLVGALLGSVLSVMLEPQYFFRPFNGCIAPFTLFLAFMTSISGVLLGLAGGAYIGIRKRGHA